jgi:hypothetical protein
MWPFLLILCIVPMCYIWSDKVVELFPALSKYLPAKEGKPHAVGGASGANSPDGASTVDALGGKAGQPSTWAEMTNERGYVAWARSSDGQYRIVVGCHPGEAAAIQLVDDSGQSTRAPLLTLNYRYGTLTLQNGYYKAADVIGAVAQFKDVYIKTPSGVLTTFTLDGVRSGTIASALQASCAQ